MNLGPSNVIAMLTFLLLSLTLLRVATSSTKLTCAGRGSHVEGISELKNYFHRFGYLTSNVTDEFDSEFESAVTQYQHKLGLQVTGRLDSDTLSQINVPRCGVRDTGNYKLLHAHKRYLHFPGNPRWARDLPATLTYSLSPENMIRYVTLADMRAVFKRAFSRWAAVVPIAFVETDDYDVSDIKIGFCSGDHGDGEPFDGALGILAHAFSPENGRFHLDAAERWAAGLEREGSEAAIDLESVVTHEIGHLLGLGHSAVREAVMYPSLKPRQRKVDLKMDDIEGVQALYGSNPNFRFASLLESDTSANHGCDSRMGSPEWFTLLLTLLLTNLVSPQLFFFYGNDFIFYN